MADKSPGQFIRLLSRSARRHIGRFDRQGFAGSEMANFAAIDDRKFVDIDLVAQDCVIEALFIFLD